MGVNGLATFVFENRKQLLRRTKLRDTRLIIDGNGICHLLFKSLNPNSDYFGGNYDEFAQLCESFFMELNSCKIESHVYFDGVQDKEKMKETQRRLGERFGRQRMISEGKAVKEENARTLPILSYETFKSVLKRKGIRHETCDGESDPQMAVSAKTFNCPILTTDSDFFVYDIPEGVVVVVDQLDLRNFRKSRTDGNYFEVEAYHISDLMFYTGLEEEDHRMIALLGTVLGNDRMSRVQFWRFFDNAKLPEKCNDFTDTTRKRKVLKALGWLQSKQKPEVAVRDLISYYGPEERGRLEKEIMRSIEVYTNPASETGVMSSDEKLPKWFADNFRKSEMSVHAMAAAIGRSVIFPPQVSAVGQPSPYECCQSARKFMYRLLLGPGTRFTVIMEYDRDKNYKVEGREVYLDPLLDGRKSIPCLNKIRDLSEEDRFSILLENLVLPLHLLEPFPKDVHALIVAIALWLRNIKLEVDRKACYFYALLACYFRNGKFDSCLTKSSGMASSHTGSTLLDRFLEVPSEISPATFDCNVVHVFSQFQCCLQTVIYLSQVLCIAPDAIHLVTGLNGTFLHNFYREHCTVESDPEPFIRKLFERNAQLFRAFHGLKLQMGETTGAAEHVLYRRS